MDAIETAGIARLRTTDAEGFVSHGSKGRGVIAPLCPLGLRDDRDAENIQRPVGEAL